jgi:hypothetical protein
LFGISDSPRNRNILPWVAVADSFQFCGVQVTVAALEQTDRIWLT